MKRFGIAVVLIGITALLTGCLLEDEHGRPLPIILPAPISPASIVRVFHIEPVDAPAENRGWAVNVEARVRDVQTFYAVQMESSETPSRLKGIET